jgi:hypothetical protein
VPVAGGIEVVTDWAVARPKPMMEESTAEDFMMSVTELNIDVDGDELAKRNQEGPRRAIARTYILSIQGPRIKLVASNSR